MTISHYKTKFLYFYLPKVHRLFYADKPNLLVNSIQKAGTHMLVNALAKSLPLKYSERGTYNHALSHTWVGDKKDRNTTPQTVADFMGTRAWPGELVRGHVEYDPQLAATLRAQKTPVILVLRNPLDMLLSLANWWERHNEIPVAPYLVYKNIEDPQSRLEFLVTGQWQGEQVWPDFVRRTQAFLGWLEDDNCLVMRYEDLLENPASQAERLRDFLPVKLEMKKFKRGLMQKNNRTYTQATEKVFKSLPDTVLQKYVALGGAELHQKMGYSL